MIGDKQTDIEAGQRAGCLSILVLTGYGETASLNPEIASVKKYSDLSAAVGWVLDRRGDL